MIPRSGQVITAQSLNALAPLTMVRKTAQAVTNSTTFVNDNLFSFLLDPGAIYHVSASLGVGGDAAGDIKISWTLPIGATGTRQCLGPAIGSTSMTTANIICTTVDWSATTAYGIGVATIIEEGVVTTMNSSGIMRMRWAQNTSHSTPTEIGANSWLSVERIE